ncbi:MAG: hypothetical protein ACLQMT_09740 [Candidatus Acidiferrales bacterium]
MKPSWKLPFVVVLSAVIASGVLAPSLQAQRPSYQIHNEIAPDAMAPGAQTAVHSGRFKLPFDAQWGGMPLPKGEYAFSVDSLTFDGTIFVYRGAYAMGMVRPQMFDDHEKQGKDFELICIRHHGKVAIRELRTRAGTFYFYLPKKFRENLAQQLQVADTVSIQVSGD